MTKQELPESVAAGRKAIEYCMVRVAIRSRNMNNQDMTDLQGLTILLRQYKKMMGRQILAQCNLTPDNSTLGEVR